MANNCIEWVALRGLRDLPLLEFLDLSKNPCSENTKLFECAVLILCPLLKKIGEKDVTSCMLAEARKASSNPLILSLLAEPDVPKKTNEESILKAIQLLCDELSPATLQKLRGSLENR